MPTTELQRMLRQFNEAFAGNDVATVLSLVTDDIHWEMAGDITVTGKADMETALREAADGEPMQLTIHHIITHGRSAAVNGELRSPTGERFGFCDVYELNGLKDPKIKKLTSYVVGLMEDGDEHHHPEDHHSH